MSVSADNSADATAIRPFTIPVTPEAEIADLRARVTATRWPDKETVPDHSQGVQLATIQELARYWATDYDWRKCEAKLNALPHFMTEIDGLDIHFIHVRSNHENALPLIATHGWPGSIIELLKIIDPLTNPTAHGGSASDAFDLVIPSMPGYGFSGKPQEPGWGPDRMARAWVELMKRLGYTHFVAQGGDWGAVVTDLMATQPPPELLGMPDPDHQVPVHPDGRGMYCQPERQPPSDRTQSVEGGLHPTRDYRPSTGPVKGSKILWPRPCSDERRQPAPGAEVSGLFHTAGAVMVSSVA